MVQGWSTRPLASSNAGCGGFHQCFDPAPGLAAPGRQFQCTSSSSWTPCGQAGSGRYPTNPAPNENGTASRRPATPRGTRRPARSRRRSRHPRTAATRWPPRRPRRRGSRCSSAGPGGSTRAAPARMRPPLPTASSSVSSASASPPSACPLVAGMPPIEHRRGHGEHHSFGPHRPPVGGGRRLEGSPGVGTISLQIFHRADPRVASSHRPPATPARQRHAQPIRTDVPSPPGGRPVDNPYPPVHEPVDNAAERVDERLPSVDERDPSVDGPNHHM